MKRYEVSYANQVLAALGTRVDSDGFVEVSVRRLAEDSGLSASAVQIGLTTLRRSGRIKTRRKGAAGRPSVIEILDVEPIGESTGTTTGVAPVSGAGGTPLADALIERYERLLVEVQDARRAPDQIEQLEARVAELEHENAQLRERLDEYLDATPSAGT